MRTLHEARKALKAVGFEIMHEEDLADRMSPRQERYRLNKSRIRRRALVLPSRGGHLEVSDLLGQ